MKEISLSGGATLTIQQAGGKTLIWPDYPVKWADKDWESRAYHQQWPQEYIAEVITPHTTEHTMSTLTLDGMTPEQLDDIAKRATATAAQKREQAKKDIIPEPGEVWEYGGYVFGVVVLSHGRWHLLRIPFGGGVVHAWYLGGDKTFSNAFGRGNEGYSTQPAGGLWRILAEDFYNAPSTAYAVLGEMAIKASDLKAK